MKARDEDVGIVGKKDATIALGRMQTSPSSGLITCNCICIDTNTNYNCICINTNTNYEFVFSFEFEFAERMQVAVIARGHENWT
jgi:hypothetical protein